MEVAHLRIESNPLERRCTLSSQQCVEERQDRVGAITRRPPRAAIGCKGGAVAPDHGPKHPKVESRRLALDSPNLIHRSAAAQTIQALSQVSGRGRQRGALVRGRRLARGAQKHLAAVLDLPSHDVPSDPRRVRAIRQHQVLRPAEQHVSSHRALHPGLEAATAIQPDDAAPILGAAVDQKWCQRHLTKHDNAGQPQQRHL
jgi:hypothetical protein